MSENELPSQIFSDQAERALLGALIINPDGVNLLDVIAEDFYVHRNRWIFEAMTSLRRRKLDLDYITLIDELDTRGKLEEIGGPAYLSLLVNETASSLNAGDYAEIIKDKARRRAVLVHAQSLAKAAYGSEPPDEAIMKAIEQLTVSMRLTAGARPFAEFASSLYDDVEERSKNPRDIFGYETGLGDFDRVTGGLQPGEVLYIGGEPGIGKSILSVQMGFGMAEHQHPGVIYSLEMLGMQVARRTVSAMARLETIKLKTGRMEGDDWSRFVQGVEHASSLPVFLCDDGYMTTAALRADLARLIARYGIRWFVLDYLYLLSDGSGTMEPTARTELLSSRIKLICKEFQLAGITVNSVTKDGEDIRGSGQVKHDADIIVMLKEHQPDMQTMNVKKDNMRTLVFKKARELAKPKAYLHLVKDDNYPAFYDFAPEPNAQRMPRKEQP